MNMREYYVNVFWKERYYVNVAWRSISYCCHNLATFAFENLLNVAFFLFSNAAVSIMILFCVIILWSVGTNFAWNDVTQHTDDIAATSPLWHVIDIKIFILQRIANTNLSFFPLPNIMDIRTLTLLV